MANGIKETFVFENVKQFKCPNCGAELRLINARTRYVGCQSCGTVADARSEAHQVVMRYNEPEKFPAKSFIKLGMRAEFDGLSHQVIGRTRWHSEYQEYWADDEGSGYEAETWHYDEWLLMSQNRTYFYIVEDNEGYAIVHPFLPKFPSAPYLISTDSADEQGGIFSSVSKSKQSVQNFNDKSSERVLEYGQSQVQYFEGESTYQISTDERVAFSMYRQGDDDFVVEARLATDGSYQEIEFFREEPIAKKWLMERFQNDPIVAAQLAEGAIIQKNTRNWQAIFGLFSTVFLFLLFTTFSGGKRVFEQSFSVAAAKDTNKTDIEPRLVGITPAFALEAGPVLLRIQASLPNGSDVWAGVEIARADGQVVNAIDGAFYYETGQEDWVEGGESGTETWEESQTNREELYRVTEPGNYTARVFVSPTSSTKTEVTVSMTTGAVPSRYYWIGLAACLFSLLAVTAASWARMPWR